MRSRKVIVHNENGLHARVALRVLEKCRALDSKVTIRKGDMNADGCSILEMLMLGAVNGAEVELVVSGGNEDKNIKAIVDVFSDGSGI